jgi:nucleotide-binding universal stress UspA family protein
VLGQCDPEDSLTRDVPKDFVESVVMEMWQAGPGGALRRPLSHRRQERAGRLKPTGECARAVAGAPLMRRAERGACGVLEVGQLQPGGDHFRHRAGAALAWNRGVREPVPRRAGRVGREILLSRAGDRANDLLVMGCYDHHRIHELPLGGVRPTVLRSMTLPVLMAHCTPVSTTSALT